VQWPVHADGTDEPLLYAKQFAFPDGKARLHPLTWVGPTDQPNAEFDLHLNNGPLARTLPRGQPDLRAAGIREKTPDTWVSLAGARRRARPPERDMVRLISR